MPINTNTQRVRRQRTKADPALAIRNRLKARFNSTGWASLEDLRAEITADPTTFHQWTNIIAESVIAGFSDFIVATRAKCCSFDEIFKKWDIVASRLGNQVATFGDLFSLYCLTDAERNFVPGDIVRRGFRGDQLVKLSNAYTNTFTDVQFYWKTYVTQNLATRDHETLMDKLKVFDSWFERRTNGFVATPFSLARKMIEKLSLNSATNVLDPACGRGTFLLIAQKKWPAGKFYGIDADPGKAYITAALLEPFSDHAPTVFVGDTVNNGPETIFERQTTMPKFDAVVGNPPYQDDLHLKFLEIAYRVADRFVAFVHPSGWLTAQKPTRTVGIKEQGDRIKSIVGNHFSSFGIINGNQIFKINLGYPCCTTIIDKKKERPEVEVNFFGRSNVTFSNAKAINPLGVDEGVFEAIKQKIWLYCSKTDNIGNHVRQPNGPHYVTIPILIGATARGRAANTADDFYEHTFYTLMRAGDDSVTDEPLKAGVSYGTKQWLAFPEKQMGKNCIRYLKTSKVAKVALMIVKNNGHLDSGELSYVPFFDFSQDWSDDAIHTKIGFTASEIEVINSLAVSNGKSVSYGTKAQHNGH